MANLQKIKDLASERNIAMKDLAEQAGLTPQALSRLMRLGSTNTETLERIAEILGVSAAVFFDPVAPVENNSSANTSDVLGDRSVYFRNVKDTQINDREIVLAALSEIAAQRKLTEVAQQQLSEMTAVVLNLTKS